MFIHTVFFWLKDNTGEQELQVFEKGLQSLLNISTVQGGYCGTPANTPRDVVDNTYTYALTVLFEDSNAHDAYQVDTVHVKFVEQNSSIWLNVKVYDYLTKR